MPSVSRERERELAASEAALAVQGPALVIPLSSICMAEVQQGHCGDCGVSHHGGFEVWCGSGLVAKPHV